VRWVEETGPRRTTGIGDFVPSESHIGVALGSWEKRIGGEVTTVEQEWVFQEMRDALRGVKGETA